MPGPSLPSAPAARPWLTGPWTAALVLGLFWVLLVAAASRSSLTVDEPGQAVAGSAYWTYNDYRLDPENGNLPQRLMALPLLSYTLPSPDSPAWGQSSAWVLAHEWFFRMGHPFEAMARGGRAACALLAVALGALVYLWCRRLYGPSCGLLALLLYVLDPTVLANGALMTSDTASALFFLLAVLALWLATFQFSLRTLAGSGLAVGLLVVSKPSAALIVPMALILWAVRTVAGPPPAVSLRGAGVLQGARARAAGFALFGLLQAAVVVLVIWAFYGFRFSAFSTALPPGHFESSFAEMLGSPPTAGQPDLRSLPARLIDLARSRHLLPEAFLYGQAHTLKFTAMRSAFLNGSFSLTGWRTFFAYTFLVKTPLPFLGILLLAGFVLARGPRFDSVPLFVLLGTYGVAAFLSPINIGHRHLLALYPPLFILAGAAALAPARGSRWALGTLVGALGLTAALTFPHYLSYMNALAGGPDHAYRHLVDSSLDWGQDLPSLKTAIDHEGGSGDVFVSYFGTSSPRAYGLGAHRLFSYPGYDVPPALQVIEAPGADIEARLQDTLAATPEYEVVGGGRRPDGNAAALLLMKAEALRLSPGTYYVSASMLQPVMYDLLGPLGPWNSRYEERYQRLRAAVAPLLSDDPTVRLSGLRTRPPSQWRLILAAFDMYRFGRLTAYLRHRSPDGTIAGSILRFRVSAEDLRQAEDGTPPENGQDEVVAAGIVPPPLPFDL